MVWIPRCGDMDDGVEKLESLKNNME